MRLNDVFKNTNYSYTLFSASTISTVESMIFVKNVRGTDYPYLNCLIRDKEIRLTPEEAVRQLYIHKLINEYGYPTSRIQLEESIHFGREVKRADIAIMDKDRPIQVRAHTSPNETTLFGHNIDGNIKRRNRRYAITANR